MGFLLRITEREDNSITSLIMSKPIENKIMHAQEYFDKVLNRLSEISKNNQSETKSIENSDLYHRALMSKLKALKNAIESDDLTPIWERSKKYHRKNNSVNKNILDAGDNWLANAIFSCYPTFKNYMSDKESEKWRSDIFKKIDELQGLISNPPPNYASSYESYRSETLSIVIDGGYHDYLYDDLKKKLNVSNPNLEMEVQENVAGIHSTIVMNEIYFYLKDNAVDSPYVNLELIKKTLEKEPNDAYMRNRKTGEDAPRSYFVRALTRGMIGRTKDPKREWVMEITNTLFTGSISKNQIINMTKDIQESPEKFIDITSRDESFLRPKCIAKDVPWI